MNTILSTTARRIALSTFAALAFSVAFPQAGFATSAEAGLWKVNPALSKADSRSSRLVIDRVKVMDGSGGAFIVINKGNVYLAAPANAASSDVKPAGFAAWKGMTITQIGTGVRAIDECHTRCRFGEVSNRLKVTFRNVGAGEQMSNILATSQ